MSSSEAEFINLTYKGKRNIFWWRRGQKNRFQNRNVKDIHKYTTDKFSTFGYDKICCLMLLKSKHFLKCKDQTVVSWCIFHYSNGIVESY